ncbi:MAG: hypothetical protein DHS20C11_27360 [Lysobacteraceae bacterium]|nr:MAG: hypothetical protein DHS20C11_27360 [Xanthomonadaceae bacterium]
MLFSEPKRAEIDDHTIKLIVGVIALSLPFLVSSFHDGLTSISQAYREGGWARDIFVGFLFAIAAFLLAFNGHTKVQMVLSKVAAFAAMGVAMFPCKCETYEEIVPHVHGVSAAIMFLILAAFCYTFFKRALSKGHPQAKVRAAIYAVCGVSIVLVILVLAYDGVTGGSIKSSFARLTFFGEAVGLVAFGVAWLTASRNLPLITAKSERLGPLAKL